jgi:3-oxoacyl-[acyl-carrier-protein] synthase-3
MTYCSILVRWGERVTPLGTTDAALPPCTRTALEMVNDVRAVQDPHGRSREGLMSAELVEMRQPSTAGA